MPEALLILLMMCMNVIHGSLHLRPMLVARVAALQVSPLPSLVFSAEIPSSLHFATIRTDEF
jgi:hypothetical protein